MKNRQADRMGEDSITRLLIDFSMPATIGMVVMASYNIIDTFFVGRLGSEAIAALSVSFPIQMLMGAIGIGTGVGAGSLISRSLGEGSSEKATRVVGQVFFLALMFGLLSTIFGSIYLEKLITAFGATPAIVAETKEYLSIVIWGALLFYLIMMLNNTVRSEGNPILPMKVMIVSAVINIILDPIFIFVLGLGIRGAAIATVLAKVLGVISLLLYYLKKQSILMIKAHHMIPRWQIIYEIYKVGLPTLLIQLSANISLILANRVLADFGHLPIAIMGLITRFQLFAFLPVIGISQGLLPIIGYNFGANKKQRIREALLKGAAVGTVFASVTGLFLFSFPDFTLRLFSSEQNLLAAGVPAVRIMVLMYPLLGVQTVSIVFFQAIGKGLPSLFLSLLRQFILYVPLIYLLPRFFNLSGIWIAAPTADLLAFLVTMSLVMREMKNQGIPLYKE